jgi:hypothetical protein
MAASLLPGAAAAQTRLQAQPSVTLAETYDDNLFVTAEKTVADEVTRLSPGLRIVGGSPRLTVRARYRLDAELYRRHPELNSATAGQLAVLDAGWTPSRSFAGKAVLSYASAAASAELNTLTGLQAGRRESSQLSTMESFGYDLGPLTKTTFEHRFIHEQVAGYPDIDTHALTLGLERRWGPRSRGRLAYTGRRFDFGADPTVAHIVTFGWVSEMSRVAHLELEAGPSLFGGTVDAEAAAHLRRRFRKGDASLGYVRTRTTVLGEPRPVTANGLTATLSRQAGPVSFGFDPSFFRVRGHASEADIDVRRLASHVTWRVKRPLAVIVSHQFTLQRGLPGATPALGAEIAHHTFQIGFAATGAAR